MSTTKTVVNSVFLVIFFIFFALALFSTIGHIMAGAWGSAMVTGLMAYVGSVLVNVFKSNLKGE